MPRAFIFLSIFLIFVQAVSAEEVTLIDGKGLIRFKKITALPVSVEFRFDCNPLALDPPPIILRHEDGLMGDQELPWTGSCRSEARGITAGRWKVRTAKDDLQAKPMPLIEVRELPTQ